MSRKGSMASMSVSEKAKARNSVSEVEPVNPFKSQLVSKASFASKKGSEPSSPQMNPFKSQIKKPSPVPRGKSPEPDVPTNPFKSSIGGPKKDFPPRSKSISEEEPPNPFKSKTLGGKPIDASPKPTLKKSMGTPTAKPGTPNRPPGSPGFAASQRSESPNISEMQKTPKIDLATPKSPLGPAPPPIDEDLIPRSPAASVTRTGSHVSQQEFIPQRSSGNIQRQVSNRSGFSKHSSVSHHTIDGTMQRQGSVTIQNVDEVNSEVCPSEAPDIHSLQRENHNLQSTVASLQRLLQDSSQNSKINRMQEDLMIKSKLISQLEKDKRDLQQDNEKLKKANRQSKRKSSMAPDDKESEIIAEQRRIIKRLEQSLESITGEVVGAAPAEAASADLNTAQSSLTNMMGGRKLSSTNNVIQVQGLQESVCALRQEVAEKDVALQLTSHKLTKAQDAIVAGITWENEVKLGETRKALEGMLRTRSKSPNVTPQKQGIQNFASTRSNRSDMRSPTAPVNISSIRSATVPSNTVLAGVQVIDINNKVIVYSSAEGGITKTVEGMRSGILYRMIYNPATGELKDSVGANGSVYLSVRAQQDGTLSKLAALADGCCCRHNIPSQSGKAAVVAGHWIEPESAPIASPQAFKSTQSLQNYQSLQTYIGLGSQSSYVSPALRSHSRSMSPNR